MSVVTFEQLGSGAFKWGVATLNSPGSLNALSAEMIQALDPQLRSWAQDASIAGVWLQGAGSKAFCAGGDVRQLAQALKTGQTALADLFFEKEYTLDHLIHVYPKPFVVWGHGIVMGGGLGLFSGASHRIVTDSTKMAMPEITIGLYPDVGGSYFLNRVPRGMGLFLGLTGARWNAADALLLNLGNTFLLDAQKEGVLQAIAAFRWSSSTAENKHLLNECLQSFEEAAAPQLPRSELAARADFFAALEASPTFSDWKQKLATAAASDTYLQKALATLESGSPVSARVIFEQIRRSRGLTLEEAFAQELCLSLQFCRHPDFPEGVRALLVDKDQRPQWSVPSPDAVPADLIEKHFQWPVKDRPSPLPQKLALQCQGDLS